MDWTPSTRLGRMVYTGKVRTIQEALATNLAVREPEIVDILLPELKDEVLQVNMVQRMTDSGRRVRFSVLTVVGNENGFVGIGQAKGKEVGPTIRKAIDHAKLNMLSVRRGCGSWKCGCGTPHTIPVEGSGKQGSVRVSFKPASRGVSLVVGDKAKPILRLAGIKDAWAFTSGHTKTTVNYALAAFKALENISKMRITPAQSKSLNIIEGMVPGTEIYMEYALQNFRCHASLIAKVHGSFPHFRRFRTRIPSSSALS